MCRVRRRAAGGDADGQRGAVEQLVLHRGAAGGVRAARAAAARAARQLIAGRVVRAASARTHLTLMTHKRTRLTRTITILTRKLSFLLVKSITKCLSNYR